LAASHLHALARQADHALDPGLRDVARPTEDDDVAALGLASVREATTLEELRDAGRALARDVG
jgi:hypothetical protein